MSKDKGGHATKKAASTETKKAPSDYQSGKTSPYKAEPIVTTKKKK